MIRRLLLFTVLACPAGGTLLHAQAQPTISGASTQVFDAAKNNVTWTNNVVLDYDGIHLRADEVVFSFTDQTLTARGHVEFTRGRQRLLADRIVYRRADGTYTAEHLRFGEYPLYVTGRAAAGSRDRITIMDARAVLREPSPLAPTFSAAKIIYTPGKLLEAEQAYAGVGPALPIALPRFGQSLEEPLLSHATLSVGYSSSLGAHLETGLHLPLAPGLKLGGDLGLYAARGVMFGPSGTYASLAEPGTLDGFFRSGFINDHGDKKNDLLGRPVPENRGFIEWGHQQALTDSLTLRADVNYWKDSEILRDFRPVAFFAVQEPDTYVESVYAGRNYLVSLFARFAPNNFEVVQQRLPELRFDLLPIALGNGFYEQFNASAAVLRQDPLQGGPVLRSDRLDGYYALSRLFTPAEWFSFTPVLGGRLTHYANTKGAALPGDYTRALGEAGFDAELRSSATFDYKNDRWKIDGLRHLLTPRLSYRYVPEGDRGRGSIPPIDRDIFSTYLPPLGLGATRNLDDLHALNTLRLGLDNTIQTRDPVYGSRDLLVFNAAADLNFRRAAGQRATSDVHAEVAFTPARWLEFDLYQSFVPQTFTLSQLHTGLTLRDGDAWSLRFANYFLRHDSEEYAIEGALRLNEVYEAVGRVKYDARQRLFVEQSYGLRQNLANTWRVEYGLTLYDGPRRESKFGFRVQVELLKF